MHWGGLAQKSFTIGWLVPIPQAFDTKQAAAIGTAGYTAMLCVLALEEHGVTPENGPILVTGASGGVGSTAVAILAKLGFEVTASTGRLDETDYLKDLGASSVIDRSELGEENPRPLQKTLWTGVVDAVGSHTLANAIAQTNANGCVAPADSLRTGYQPSDAFHTTRRHTCWRELCSRSRSPENGMGQDGN